MGFGDEIPKRVLGRQPYRSPSASIISQGAKHSKKHKIDIRQAGLDNKNRRHSALAGCRLFLYI